METPHPESAHLEQLHPISLSPQPYVSCAYAYETRKGIEMYQGFMDALLDKMSTRETVKVPGVDFVLAVSKAL